MAFDCAQAERSEGTGGAEEGWFARRRGERGGVSPAADGTRQNQPGGRRMTRAAKATPSASPRLRANPLSPYRPANRANASPETRCTVHSSIARAPIAR